MISVLNAPMLVFLGIQNRYWAIIIVVVVILLILGYYATRGRAT